MKGVSSSVRPGGQFHDSFDTATTRDILHLHHEAFRAAVRLVPGFNSAVLRNLADAATAGFIVDFYGNFGGHVPAVWYFRKGKMAEDA